MRNVSESFDESFVPTSSSTDHWHHLLISIAVGGIIANMTLLWRRRNTGKKPSSTTKTSLFLLSAMAAADTLCLLSLLFMLTQRYFKITHPFFLNMVCKMDLFVLHATSAFSIWCWLVLSAVRYVAVYRPYTHLRLNREPHFAVLCLAAFCCLLEAFVLFDSQFDPVTKSCTSSSSESLSKKMQISEIIASYFLPVAIITILDLKVLLCREIWTTNNPKKSNVPDRAHSTFSRRISMEEFRQKSDVTHKISLNEASTTNNNDSTNRRSSKSVSSSYILRTNTRSRKRLQQLRVLRRCLCITIFDLSMNLPSYLLRLYLTIISQEEYESLDMNVVGIVENLSQVLYFAQFALNAVYLVCIIYDTPKSKSNLQTPLSLQVSNSVSPRYASDRRAFRFSSDAGGALL